MRLSHKLISLLVPALFLLPAGCQDGSEPSTAPTGPATEQALASTPLAFDRISVGTQHTCAITFDNRAYCWGKNTTGAVGNGSSAFAVTRPALVAGNLRFAQISAGDDYTCGVTTANKAYCWGDNWSGQLGDNSPSPHINRSTPFPVAGGRSFRLIIAGFAHTCAVTPANEAFCWGRNGYGTVGDGTNTDQVLLPSKVKGMHSWRRVVAGGNHTCGVTTDNRAFCWGQNDRGQLGINTFTNRNTPVAVAGGISFVQVTAGASHTCALTSENRAYCWGENEQGALGDGGTSQVRKVPFPVVGTRRYRQVIAGFLHTCGVTMANVAFCWGFNFQGQNGDGTTNWSNVPTRVAGGHAFAAIATGVQEPPPFVNSDAMHSCALDTNDRAWCWGNNAYGKLGNGTTSLPVLTPVAVVGP